MQKNGNSFLPSRIDFILKNTFYYGVMKVKGEFYPHKHPPLIAEALFQRAQDVMKRHHKAPVQYAGKPILFRGLISCQHCGCTVTGDIKKEKYVYYSCNNSKGLCKKSWVREEELLGPLLKYLDEIQLPDALIEDVVAYLKQAFQKEQAFFHQSQAHLRQELDLIQKRLSRLVDEHLDGKVEGDFYHIKLEEYKKRQRELTQEMQAYVEADETCLITAKTVLDLAKWAKEIFVSSRLEEKQQLSNVVFSNLKLEGSKLVVTLRDLFQTIIAVSHQPTDLHAWDTLRTFAWSRLSTLLQTYKTSCYKPTSYNSY